ARVTWSGPELEQLLELDSRLGCQGLEVAGSEVAVEALVPCGNRRVRGKDRRAADELERTVEGEPLLRHERPDALEREKGRLPFVEWDNGRPDPGRPEGSPAPHPQDQLLARPVLTVSSVQGVGDRPSVRVVRLEVGVEQVGRRTSNVDPPDLDENGLSGEL